MHSSRSGLVVLDEEQLGPFRARLVLAVGTDLPVFDAHFPGHAIYPAYLEVREAVRHSRRSWPDLGAWQGANSIKFKAAVTPGMQIALELRRDEAAPHVRFTIAHHTNVCAKGDLCFASPQGSSR